jgi:putative protease
MADEAAKGDKDFYLSLPHICRLTTYERLEKDLYGVIKKDSISGFLVRNFEEVSLLESLPIEKGQEKEIILDYNMYVYNKEAKEFWREKGITHFTAPVELNYQELKQLEINDCDILVYGYLPLMVSAQCLMESTQGCRKCRQNHSGILTDRLGKKFFIQTNCTGCYNIIYNGQVLSLHKQAAEIAALNPENIRMNFSMESKGQMNQVLNLYMDLFYYRKNTKEQLSEYTTGHFKRGVE